MIDRTIEVETEVPGTPEEVWDAIATGHGITTWWVPAKVEERVGGTISLDFGPGFGTQTGEVTVFDPPHRFVYAADGLSGYRLAFEWRVEAQAGGTCVVRLVNSGFLSEADWKAEYDATLEGWKLFLYNLRLARTHFPGEPCASIMVHGTSDKSLEETWRMVSSAIGFPEAPRLDEHLASTVDGSLTLAGTVQRFERRLLTLLLDAPMRGIGFVGAEGLGGSVFVSVYLYLYGAGAPRVVERDTPAWRAWMQHHFAPVTAPA
jgi:uncharacterized protein YndB with AHSA1/START domain